MSKYTSCITLIYFHLNYSIETKPIFIVYSYLNSFGPTSQISIGISWCLHMRIIWKCSIATYSQIFSYKNKYRTEIYAKVLIPVQIFLSKKKKKLCESNNQISPPIKNILPTLKKWNIHWSYFGSVLLPCRIL